MMKNIVNMNWNIFPPAESAFCFSRGPADGPGSAGHSGRPSAGMRGHGRQYDRGPQSHHRGESGDDGSDHVQSGDPQKETSLRNRRRLPVPIRNPKSHPVPGNPGRIPGYGIQKTKTDIQRFSGRNHPARGGSFAGDCYIKELVSIAPTKNPRNGIVENSVSGIILSNIQP